jgi:hypothetical protein
VREVAILRDFAQFLLFVPVPGKPHFDGYDHTVTGKGGAQVKYVFAPFSHDAEVPEPSTLLLIGAGIGVALLRRR